MANQRRVRLAQPDEEGRDEIEVDFDELEVLISDETSWVLVGDTWVDASRIISVGPLESIWDESQAAEGIPRPTGGVAVQVDSPHPDSQFIQDGDETVESVMSRIIEATTD